jgi:signal transduction histidine kinase/ActR/RegA family two-component response regulator
VGFVQDYELELTRKDGSTLTGILTATVKRNEAGEVVAYRSICRDVTEYRKLEADFLRAQRLENLGSLASGIAHDLNNILSPILMGTQLLASRIDDARSRKTLDTIELSATRAGDLVKQILTFARGSGTERRPTQLRGVVRDIHKIAAETFPKSISIVVHVAEDLGMVQGNVTELHQLLMNLAVNARDAMASHGNLRISARNVAVDDPDAARMNLSPGPHVLLEVSDDGEGILEDLREKIFESFFTTKADGAGTGLGLPTVLAIARNHGGAIDLSSEVGKGTTFGIYLPALVSRDAEPAPQTRNLSAGMGQLVLLVDDEAAFREIAAATLETFGYRVLTAADGLDALDLFRRYKEDIRVVLTDLELPRLGGRDLAGRIRRLDGKIPVIGMSGAKPENQKNTVAVPEVFSAFLEKPFSNQEILESLGRALSFGPSSAP